MFVCMFRDSINHRMSHPAKSGFSIFCSSSWSAVAQTTTTKNACRNSWMLLLFLIASISNLSVCISVYGCSTIFAFDCVCIRLCSPFFSFALSCVDNNQAASQLAIQQLFHVNAANEYALICVSRCWKLIISKSCCCCICKPQIWTEFCWTLILCSNTTEKNHWNWTRTTKREESKHHSWMSNGIKYLFSRLNENITSHPKGQIYSCLFFLLILNFKFLWTIESWKPFGRYNLLNINQQLNAPSVQITN